MRVLFFSHFANNMNNKQKYTQKIQYEKLNKISTEPYKKQ